MPLYEFQCPQGHTIQRYVALAHFHLLQACDVHPGEEITRLISAPLHVSATPVVCYDSPINGQPITSMAARAEDMARAQCHEYDPEQKTDARRVHADADAALEKAVDATVEEVIEKMPTKARGRLMAELDAGANLEVTR